MKYLMIVLGLFATCSLDKGLTRTTWDIADGVVFYGNNGFLEFRTTDNQVILAHPDAECVIILSDKRPITDGLIEAPHEEPK